MKLRDRNNSINNNGIDGKNENEDLNKILESKDRLNVKENLELKDKNTISENKIMETSDEETSAQSILKKTEIVMESLSNKPQYDIIKQTLASITSKEEINSVSDVIGNDNTENNVSVKKLKATNRTDKPENIHKHHRSRLKTQFLENGGNSLTDIQILELLLFFAIPQKDTNPLAHKLINKFGSIKNVLMADKNRLMTVDGIKENSATLITLVNSLFKYISKPNEGDVISSVLEAKKFCRNLFVGADVEQFYVICLSKGNMVKAVKSVQTGTSDEIAVQIRTITEFALESKCNRIIITHNHPFGSAAMSDEDYSFTYSLICSCLLNSIDVVDHIIVGMDSINSFASQKLLNQLKTKAIKNINIPISSMKILSSYEEEYIIDDNH